MLRVPIQRRCVLICAGHEIASRAGRATGVRLPDRRSTIDAIAVDVQRFLQQPDPFRWRVGLRPLPIEAWLDLDDVDELDDAVAAKAAVMQAHPGVAFAALDDVDDDASEVAAALAGHLGEHRRDRPVVLDPELHPLDAIARHVAEDLVMMVERDGCLVVGAGSVCFPNRWDLASKLGRPLIEVHAPVARLNEQLAGPIDGVVGRLTSERLVWRTGWGVADRPDRFYPPWLPPPTEPVAPSQHVLRLERETLRRFSRCVVFTIGTTIVPLSELAPSARSLLAAAIDGLPDDVARYKGLADRRDEIAAWLVSGL